METKLATLGWSGFFQQQLSLEEYQDYKPFRVLQQHRDQLTVAGEAGEQDIPVLHFMPALTVGDWILLDANSGFIRLLERKSLFSRKAAGSKVAEQLIAANIDTAFLVCSLNQDFNLSRIERYLALIHESGAEPVVVLTKADLVDDAEAMVAKVRALDSLLMVEAVNGMDETSVEPLRVWCKPGSTIVFLGSSGVGKSTLANTLMGSHALETGGIREDDSKGRHTTTARSLHLLQEGGLLLDTPGMRELQLADVELGLEKTFADIHQMSEHCRFSDCRHHSEPGCAVLAAIQAGELEERRLLNYRKLLKEQEMNSASLAQKRSRDKALGKFYRSVLDESRQRRKEH
ncbi:MAG: ribosome small subunit-dependent GTPase A [Halioglobus sp.]